MRLDKFLKVSRVIKRRTVANEACDNGHVEVNGKVARASLDVKTGDIVRIAFGDAVEIVQHRQERLDAVAPALLVAIEPHRGVALAEIVEIRLIAL